MPAHHASVRTCSEYPDLRSLIQDGDGLHRRKPESDLTSRGETRRQTSDVRAAMNYFIRGHVEAFRAFNPVPRILLYDNLESSVLERAGSAICLDPTLLKLAAHYRLSSTGSRRAGQREGPCGAGDPFRARRLLHAQSRLPVPSPCPLTFAAGATVLAARPAAVRHATRLRLLPPRVQHCAPLPARVHPCRAHRDWLIRLVVSDVAVQAGLHARVDESHPVEPVRQGAARAFGT